MKNSESIIGNTIDGWFTIEQIDRDTHVISEYKHWEETHAYLLNGNEYSLLIDTGLGIKNIYDEVIKLTDKPVIVVATHIHWDHIGGHQYFPNFYVHKDEIDWLNGKFPLPLEQIKGYVTERCELPKDFDINKYEFFQGTAKRILQDNDTIDIGDRVISVLHTPGHSPGHMCFYENSRGYLFTGDLVYKDTLLAYYPSTDPMAYLQSIKKIEALSAKRIFPAHHSLDIHPEILTRIKVELKALNANGQLRHGSGMFHFGDWAIWL